MELSSIKGESSISKPVSCEELTDGFCKTLWSADNQGNFQFSDGTQIFYGERRKNIIGNARFIYLQKLVKNRCNMPKDVKDLMGIHCGYEDKKEDILARLEALLSQVDSIDQNKIAIESWQRSLNKMLLDFEHIIKDTAYKRSIRENQDLSEKLWDDYAPSDKKTFNGHYYDIKTEIMDSIYLKDLDWLRVVKVFDEVKADILTVIDLIAFSPETKQIMKEKINLLKLSLPYEDPRTMYSGKFCATSERNAHYNSSQNSFAFCIGYINTAGNEGALYHIAGHEITHSIDPDFFQKDTFQQSPLSHTLRTLYESNASLPCEKWERQKSENFILPSEIYQLPESLAAIDQCLVDRQHLSELNHQSLDYVSKRFAENSIHSYARNHTFSYLTTPEIFKKGVLKNNEFYLEPKLFAESKNNYFKNEYFLSGYFHKASVFIQEYKCRLQPGITEQQAFTEAIEETKRLNTVYQYYYLSILGRNARPLVHFNLSKPSNEDFADWISYKAVELKLQRMLSLKNRREFVLADTALFCQPEGLESIAKHKTLIEKNYSKNIHSPDRDRRLKNFTSKTADFLQCTRGEEIKKLNKSCDFLIESLH